jgi:hypothetical protein
MLLRSEFRKAIGVLAIVIERQKASLRLGPLDQIPEVAVDILEHRDRAVALAGGLPRDQTHQR